MGAAWRKLPYLRSGTAVVQHAGCGTLTWQAGWRGADASSGQVLEGRRHATQASWPPSTSFDLLQPPSSSVDLRTDARAQLHLRLVVAPRTGHFNFNVRYNNFATNNSNADNMNANFVTTNLSATLSDVPVIYFESLRTFVAPRAPSWAAPTDAESPVSNTWLDELRVAGKIALAAVMEIHKAQKDPLAFTWYFSALFDHAHTLAVENRAIELEFHGLQVVQNSFPKQVGKVTCRLNAAHQLIAFLERFVAGGSVEAGDFDPVSFPISQSPQLSQH